MFENPRRGRQARNFTTNVPKILDLKSSSEQIFLENWHWVPLITSTLCVKNVLPFLNGFGIRSKKIVIHLNGLGYLFGKNCRPFEQLVLSVPKRMSSVWTAWAVCLEKIVMNLLERLGISVSKNCYPFGWLGLSIRKRNCRPLEELNLSVQR